MPEDRVKTIHNAEPVGFGMRGWTSLVVPQTIVFAMLLLKDVANTQVVIDQHGFACLFARGYQDFAWRRGGGVGMAVVGRVCGWVEVGSVRLLYVSVLGFIVMSLCFYFCVTLILA